MLAVGSEREGLSPRVLNRADQVVSLPMEDGVSSLNLATAVSAMLYAWRLARALKPSGSHLRQHGLLQQLRQPVVGIGASARSSAMLTTAPPPAW